jgi:sulfotransferase family protein
MSRRAPNLFIVGAPRCGTSAMFRLLAQHPDVSVSSPKEPYYFCTDFHEESDRYHSGKTMRFPVRSEAQYLTLFGDMSRTVVAEATPAYLYSSVAASRIHAFNPDARILVMVRDPVVLLHSLHAKMASHGLEDLTDFRQALEAEAARRAGRRLPAGLFWPSSLYYSEWVRLGEQIERYRRLFPADRVKTVVFDDFQRDNAATYAEVIEFLGLRSACLPEYRVVNANRAARSPRLAQALAWCGDRRIKRFVPARARRRLRRALRDANLRPARRSPLDAGLRRDLMARFWPEVEALSRLLERDLLSLWGYERSGA